MASEKKRTVFFHVGPGKMATTTFQKSLKIAKAKLHRDDFCVYDSEKGLRVLMLLYDAKDAASVKENLLWKDFMNFLDHCHDIQQNVILSSEYMGYLEPWKWNELLKPALERWTFSLMVGYRLWYMWYPSVHFQIFRFKSSEGWPDSNNINIVPPLLEFHRDERTKVLFTEDYINHWKSLLSPQKLDVVVYNMHEDPNVLKTIYCGILNATQTCCDFLHIVPAQENKGFSLEYDRIAVAAHEAGLLSPELDRLTAADKIEMHFNSNGLSLSMLPRECVEGEEKEYILEQSLQYDKMFGSLSLAGGNSSTETFARVFSEFADENLCSIDIGAVLKLYKDALKQLV